MAESLRDALLGAADKLEANAKEREEKGLVLIGDEVVDVAAAFEPFAGKEWAVVAHTDPPAQWPPFLDVAQRLGWEFRYAHDHREWTFLFFRRFPPLRTLFTSSDSRDWK